MLTPDQRHRKVFPEVVIVGLKRGKIREDLLVSAKVPETDEKMLTLHFFRGKNTFTNKEGSDTYKTREGFHLNCNSENVIYLIICKKCKKQYVGSCITRLRTRFNDYRSCHRTFCRDHFVIQVSFHPHFLLWYRRVGNYFN